MNNYIIYIKQYGEKETYIEEPIEENTIERAIEHYNDKIFELNFLKLESPYYKQQNNLIIDTRDNSIIYEVKISQLIDL